MRKFIPLVAIAVVAIIFTSCKKRDYVCTCTENHGGNYVKTNYKLGNVNDNTAQNMCSDKQLSLSSSGYASQCYTTF